MTTRRTSTAPRRADKQRIKETAPDIVVKVDGTDYAVRADEISAVDASLLRRQTGMSVRAVMQAADDDPDIDIVAALVWLARRQAGETGVRFEDVAAEITYGSDVAAGDVAEGESEGEGRAVS